jgi:predicted carbohydrate-binding protein with CBM5 and CBM33 domain
VPNIAGRDRQLIPDGKLCSGGLAAFKGLDLGRADWPTTTVSSGAAFTFKYKASIPHEGSFRLYVTHDGYDPRTPLRWADLVATPFLTVTDPTLRGGVYALNGKLPPGRTGRQLIFTVWQTSSTPDTYYSCSDVVFTGGAGAAAPGQPAASTGGATTAATGPAVGAPTAGSSPPGDPPVVDAAPPAGTGSAVAIRRTSGSRGMVPIAGGATVLLGLGALGFVLARRRRAG